MINFNYEVGGWGWSFNFFEIWILIEYFILGIK